MAKGHQKPYEANTNDIRVNDSIRQEPHL